MKKIPIHRHQLVSLLAALLVPHAAYAQVVITEIMYDPPGLDSGHEWIEVYDAGTSPIPLASWKLYEGDASHNIIEVSGEQAIAPGSYAVIAASAAKFEADHPDFSGALFHAAYSLDNGGSMIGLRAASGQLVESATYDSSAGALGDGNSLDRPPSDAAQFSPHAPTPGAAMSSSVIPRKIRAVLTGTSTKASRKKTTTSSEVKPRTDSNDAGNMAVVAPQAAAAAASDPDDPYWWLALIALLALAAGAVFASRRFKKHEWDIIEETPEDV